jgi:hypothetical protein
LNFRGSTWQFPSSRVAFRAKFADYRARAFFKSDFCAHALAFFLCQDNAGFDELKTLELRRVCTLWKVEKRTRVHTSGFLELRARKGLLYDVAITSHESRLRQCVTLGPKTNTRTSEKAVKCVAAAHRPSPVDARSRSRLVDESQHRLAPVRVTSASAKQGRGSRYARKSEHTRCAFVTRRFLSLNWCWVSRSVTGTANARCRASVDRQTVFH